MKFKDALTEHSRRKQVVRVWQEVIGILGQYLDTDVRDASKKLSTDDGIEVETPQVRVVIDEVQRLVEKAERLVREMEGEEIDHAKEQQAATKIAKSKGGAKAQPAGAQEAEEAGGGPAGQAPDTRGGQPAARGPQKGVARLRSPKPAGVGSRPGGEPQTK